MSKRGGLNKRSARTRKFFLFKRHRVDLFGVLFLKSRKRWRVVNRFFAATRRKLNPNR
jgi:hypothetical protein